eukprot:697119-Hanusia_phi.AAC.1
MLVERAWGSRTSSMPVQVNGQHGGHECCVCRSERREYEVAMDVEGEVVLGSVGVHVSST